MNMNRTTIVDSEGTALLAPGVVHTNGSLVSIKQRRGHEGLVYRKRGVLRTLRRARWIPLIKRPGQRIPCLRFQRFFQFDGMIERVVLRGQQGLLDRAILLRNYKRNRNLRQTGARMKRRETTPENYDGKTAKCKYSTKKQDATVQRSIVDISPLSSSVMVTRTTAIHFLGVFRQEVGFREELFFTRFLSSSAFSTYPTIHLIKVVLR